MQPSNQSDQQARVETRLRSMRTVWVGMFLSVGLYYMLTLFTGNPHEDVSPNKRLFMALAATGTIVAVIAVLIKQKFLNQSEAEQRVELVQTGYVVAWAVTEVAALLGLLDFFLSGNRHYYVLFIIAACGHLFNFPRRRHLLSASFKSPTF